MQFVVISHVCRASRGPRAPARRRRGGGGFSLVEVLVAIVVLAFGVLGMVGLQAASLQFNRDARLQSSAILYARELAEMMRGNKDAALASGALNPYIGSYTGASMASNATNCLAIGSSCADASVATGQLNLGKAQMADWLARVDADLPGARIEICRDTTPFDAQGLPVWDCTAAAGEPIVIKMGWARKSTQSGTAAEAPARPAVVLSVTAGVA